MSSSDVTEHRLYAILDLAYVRDENAANVAKELVQGGADLVQLRGKGRTVDELAVLAEKLLPICDEGGVPLIVNDHAEIARRVPVHGVHVGQDDEAVASVRAKVGRAITVGKSTHSIEQAIAAEREGADYIGFGPLFATPTKPDYAAIGLDGIGEVHRRVTIAIFCIGGINVNNLQQVIDAGARRVVMVSAILRARNIVDYVRCATDMLA